MTCNVCGPRWGFVRMYVRTYYSHTAACLHHGWRRVRRTDNVYGIHVDWRHGIHDIDWSYSIDVYRWCRVCRIDWSHSIHVYRWRRVRGCRHA
jgi:hypothetical protein